MSRFARWAADVGLMGLGGTIIHVGGRAGIDPPASVAVIFLGLMLIRIGVKIGGGK